jgi:hypothetical protein
VFACVSVRVCVCVRLSVCLCGKNSSLTFILLLRITLSIIKIKIIHSFFLAIFLYIFLIFAFHFTLFPPLLLSSSWVALISLMMEVVSTSETSVNFYEAIRRNIQESSSSSSLCLFLTFFPSLFPSYLFYYPFLSAWHVSCSCNQSFQNQHHLSLITGPHTGSAGQVDTDRWRDMGQSDRSRKEQKSR